MYESLCSFCDCLAWPLKILSSNTARVNFEAFALISGRASSSVVVELLTKLRIATAKLSAQSQLHGKPCL